jgi:lipopolysaccharide export LptBFGC system permease protein LptF
MLEKLSKLTNLWEKNKILFFIALPIIIIVIALKFFLAYNAEAGRQDVIDAENKDKELNKKANELNNKADNHLAKADQISKDKENISVDLDWHKKMGD